MSKFADRFSRLAERYRYPWDQPRPQVSPMEGIHRKHYVHNGKRVSIFVLKGDKFSEVKFFIDGTPRYVVSFNSYDDLLDSLEQTEKDFKKGFLEEWGHKEEPDSDDRLATLGYK